MIRNYIKVAFRNFKNEWVYSSINVLGLSLGIGISIIIFQYVQFEMSYDKFHKEVDNLYKVTMEWDFGHRIEAKGLCHPPIGPLMFDELEEVESFCRVITNPTKEDKKVSFIKKSGTDKYIEQENVVFADSNFFEVYSFPLLEGNPKTVLSKPFTAAISRSTSEKLFGKESAIGQLIEFQDGPSRGDYEITGVFEDIPENSSDRFEIIRSMASLESNLIKGGFKLNELWSFPAVSTIVKIQPESDIEIIEKRTRTLMEVPLAKAEAAYNLVENIKLIPFKDYYFEEFGLDQSIKFHGDKRVLNILIVMSFLILLISWVNYVNLNTARSVRRAKEVSLRKVNGATKKSLAIQFFTESLLINIFSTFFGLLIAQLGYPIFSQIIGSSSQLLLMELPVFWMGIILFVILSSLIIGIYPVLILSGYNPSSVLMGSFSRSTKGSIVRKLLVFVQFMLGASFIAAVYVINLQVEHMRQDNDGFSVEKVVVVKLRGISNEQKNKTFHLFEEKLNSLPEIESVSGSFTYPGDKNFGEQALSKNKADLMRIMFDINVVSSEYFTTLSHNLVAGAYFADQVGANSEDCILNELAVEELGYSNPLEAIGQTVYFNRLEREFTIIGVIQNYYRNTKKVRLVPEIFFTEFTEIGPNIKLGNILIKITGDEKDFMTTLGKIEKTWQEVNPDKAFDYRLVDQVFERILYQENQFKSVFAFFTLMGVFVCCLGLFGLSSYNTTSRIKEIGIRKTMGGSIGGIVWLFSRDYLKLILASSAIGLPIGIYFLNEWLKNYPSRVSIGVDALLIPLIIIITISALTVGYQTYHSAQINPINSLRNE